MNNNEKVLFLIKFGEKDHLNSLLKRGELYFNSPKKFNEIKELNSEQGDENEGAIWIENMRSVQLSYMHPKHGEIKFKPVPGKLSKLTQFNHNYLTCSFFAITNKDFEKSNILKIDKKMSEFGEYALVISNPKTFIHDVINKTNQENLELEINKIEYKDLNKEGRIELNPFIKKFEHNYQKEFRMVIKNIVQPFKIIKVKGLKDNGTIMESAYLKELKIESIV